MIDPYPYTQQELPSILIRRARQGAANRIKGCLPGGVLFLLSLALGARLLPAQQSMDTAEPPHVDESVMASRLTKQVQPVYPPLASSAHVQGAVVLSLHVGKDGSVLDVKLLRGHPLLVSSAVAAVRQWHYRPFLVQGQPTEVITTVTVPFHLADAKAPDIEKLREAVQLNPHDVSAHEQLAHALLAQNRTEEAVREFEEVVRLTPESARAHGQLAQALERQRDTDAAIAEYRKAREIDPKDGEWHRALAKLLLHSGQREGALAEYRQLLQENPNRSDLGEFASILYFTGPFPQATMELSAIVDQQPNAAELHRDIGNHLKESWFLAAGIVQMREALRINPNDTDAKSDLEQLLGIREREQESLSKVRDEISKDPAHGRYDMLASLSYLVDGDADAVTAILNNGLRTQPENKQLQNTLDQFVQCHCASALGRKSDRSAVQ